MNRICLVIVMVLCFCCGAAAGDMPEKDALDGPHIKWLEKTFKSRRSVRRFKDTPVPENHLEWILDMARTAPTSGNQQPWKFLVVRERIAALHKACVAHALQRPGAAEREKRIRDYYAKVFSAPLFVVVLVDTQSRYPTYNRHDGPLAAGYLIMAARALGYGSVYFTDSIPEPVTRKVLAIPDRWERVCVIPLGIPQEWPVPPFKRNLQDFIARETLTD